MTEQTYTLTAAQIADIVRGTVEVLTAKSDEAPAKPLGTKSTPNVGELWLTRGGGIAAVVRIRQPDLRNARTRVCTLLTKGDTAVDTPYRFEVYADGQYDYTEEHSLDLVKLHGNFLTP